ncbi:uncharacterized protein LOC124385259 [Tachysurus ichikawai]
MDDLTILTTTKVCTVRLLRKLQENIERARMKIKPSKSRSISIIKGKLSDHRFHVGRETIPTVSEKPVKSLGGKAGETGQLICKEVAWPSQVPQQYWILWQRDATPANFQSGRGVQVCESQTGDDATGFERSICSPSCPHLGHRATPLAATEQAKAALGHKDIVG